MVNWNLPILLRGLLLLLDKNKLQQIVKKLSLLTRKQEAALLDKDIEHFRRLATERKQCVDELVGFFSTEEEKQLLHELDLMAEIQEILSIDQRNIQVISELMEETENQLRQMTTGRSAFYAYAGKGNPRQNDESYFIDKQML